MVPPRRLSRPMGNDQSRNTALGRAPQSNFTPNVNGAQTASSTANMQARVRRPGGPVTNSDWKPRPVSMKDPSTWVQWPDNKGPIEQIDQWSQANGKEYFQFPQQNVEQSNQQIMGERQQVDKSTYAGGDVAGQARYYRNTALQQYAPSAQPWFPPQEHNVLNGGPPLRPPDANLSGTQGMPASSTSALAGSLMGGFAGAGVSGYMTGLGAGYGASQVQRDRTNSAIGRNSDPNSVGPQANPMQTGPWDQRQVDLARTQEFLNQNPMAGNSNQAGLAAGRIPANMQNPMTMGSVNGYNGRFPSNRPMPDQEFAQAEDAYRKKNAYDPTNQGGNRFAGSAARIQAAEAYDQAAIAAGTQAERQRMQGVASDSADRAMDPKSTGRQFAYENQQGEMVATNRLGTLQQMQKNGRSQDDVDLKIAIAEEQQRGSALGKKQEEQRDRRRAASSDGLTDKERRRLGYRDQVANNAMTKGILPMSKDPSRPGFSHQERIARNHQQAKDQSNFRSSETKIRRSALDAENAQNLGSLHDRQAKADRTVDENGQLNPTIRDSAKSTLKNINDPNYQGSREFKQNQHHVAAYGLTPWSAEADGDSPMDVATKVQNKGITNLQQATALRKYWNAQKDSDAEWMKQAEGANNPSVALMAEMAEIPESELPQWFEENKGRLISAKTEYEKPEHRTNPDSGYLRDNMPNQMFN